MTNVFDFNAQTYGAEAFDAAIYGVPSQQAVDAVREQFYQGWENLTDMGKQFVQDAAAFVEDNTSHESLRRIRALARKTQHIWDDDIIRPLTDIGAVQHAQPEMQRWIMACPEVRTAYHANRLDGYSDSYKDYEPGAVGEAHHDYRVATDGLMLEQEDGSSCFTSYWDSSWDDATDNLDIQEQADIQTSWDMARAAIKAGREDPTSRFNNRL